MVCQMEELLVSLLFGGCLVAAGHGSFVGAFVRAMLFVNRCDAWPLLLPLDNTVGRSGLLACLFG